MSDLVTLLDAAGGKAETEANWDRRSAKSESVSTYENCDKKAQLTQGLPATAVRI